jgi:ribonuclease HI
MANPIRVFTDGACQPNPGMMGIGVVVEWTNQMPEIISKGKGFGTNNIAEYSALIEALDVIENNTILNADINSDSKLMVSQVNGTWQCKDQTLKPLCSQAKDRIKHLNKNGFNVTLKYLPREFNLADSPAKKGCRL